MRWEPPNPVRTEKTAALALEFQEGEAAVILVDPETKDTVCQIMLFEDDGRCILNRIPDVVAEKYGIQLNDESEIQFL